MFGLSQIQISLVYAEYTRWEKYWINQLKNNVAYPGIIAVKHFLKDYMMQILTKHDADLNKAYVYIWLHQGVKAHLDISNTNYKFLHGAAYYHAFMGENVEIMLEYD